MLCLSFGFFSQFAFNRSPIIFRIGTRSKWISGIWMSPMNRFAAILAQVEPAG
jgi:hypothetical protein